MFRPNPNELSRYSGRRPDELARWLGYPAWLREKGARYLRIAHDSQIREENEKLNELRDWLKAG
jgi:hypothetical protein